MQRRAQGSYYLAANPIGTVKPDFMPPPSSFPDHHQALNTSATKAPLRKELRQGKVGEVLAEDRGDGGKGSRTFRLLPFD